MEVGKYRTIQSDRFSVKASEDHCKEGQTCQALKRLLRCTLERTEEDEMEGLNFIREQLKLVQFRKH